MRVDPWGRSPPLPVSEDGFIARVTRLCCLYSGWRGLEAFVWLPMDLSEEECCLTPRSCAGVGEQERTVCEPADSMLMSNEWGGNEMCWRNATNQLRRSEIVVQSASRGRRAW
jgi:hypothetical protein